MIRTLEGSLIDGRYRVGAVIGRGAQSVVHEAEDLALARLVAVKFVQGDDAALATERLFREAKAAARADHPAVVTVFGFGVDEDGDIPYLVMERLRGEDLAMRLSRVGALPIPLVLEIGVEIADAIAHVHAAGVLHRDLKPANVFLASRGLRADEIKLLDFGVAKHLDMQTLTAPGELVGTLRYMAPEQLTHPQKPDLHWDIYALGAMLYECSSAASPYDAETPMQLATAIVGGRRIPLRARRPELSQAFCEVVERCLALRPGDRYVSARELCSRLIDARNELETSVASRT